MITQTKESVVYLQHRLEMLCERFGIQPLIEKEALLIPKAFLERCFWGGKPLWPSLSSRVMQYFPNAVTVVVEGLRFDFVSGHLSLAQRVEDFLQDLSLHNPALVHLRSRIRWDSPKTPSIPLDEALEDSKEWLERAHQGGFVTKEKKPLVVDYRNCYGDFLVSVDQEEEGAPKASLLDGSAQIASHLVGINHASLLGTAIYPESWQNPDYRERWVELESLFKEELLRWCHPNLSHVTWVNSGTEANEKAYYLARLLSPSQGEKVLAFKGSFHGRSLLSLYASYNPVKREPYEIDKYKGIFVDYPENKEPHLERVEPEDWLEVWSKAKREDFLLPHWQEDELLETECRCLMEVRKHLAEERAYTVVIEPLQCEGGDRYASKRFFRALRVLTRAFEIPLIFDEVQSGFGLGGTPLWHERFDLEDAQGESDHPDFVCLAKKCQVGAVLSVLEDPTPTAAHAASLARGYFHCLSVSRGKFGRVEEAIAERMAILKEKFPQIEYPRSRGLCFAFDMPSNELANKVIVQRYLRGVMIYIAGVRTLRFRLQLTTKKSDIALCFDQIEKSLEAVFGEGEVQADFSQSQPSYDFFVPEVGDLSGEIAWHRLIRFLGEPSSETLEKFSELSEDPKELLAWFADQDEMSWSEFLQGYAVSSHLVSKIVDLNLENWQKYRDQVLAIEEEVYEPTRRDSPETFDFWAEHPQGIHGIALMKEKVVGFYFSIPLEAVAQVRGPHEDEALYKNTCLYSADLTVSPSYHGRGLGTRLKMIQIDRGKEKGFRAIRSRNREGVADSMISINLRFGSKRLAIYPNDYGEDNATCHYWSAPLDKSYKGESDIALWSNGVEEPIGRTDLSSRTLGWDLPALTKLSLCNWWTPNTVRYVEWWRSIAPQGMHFYWSSGRDEATDKVMKCLIKKRPKAHRALSFQGAYWGHTTACCRSLSDLGLAISGYFDWPHLPYPEVTEGSPFEGSHDEGKEAKFWQQLRVWENKSEQLLGIFVEPFQERTGRFLSQEFLLKLQKWCRDQDVPLVLNESASWAYRLSDQLFFSQAAGLDPDAIVVYAGGQMGHALLNDKYFIDTPLAMISTWDGDELSGLRLQTQIQMVQEYLERYGSPEQWDEQLRAMGGVVYRGHGTIPRSRVTAFHQHQLWPSSVSGYQSILLPPLTEWVIEGQEQVKAWEEGFHG